MEMPPIPQKTIAWPSLDAKLKTLSFADKSNQWVKVPVSTVSLDWVKCLKYTKYTHSQSLDLRNTSYNAKRRL